MWGLVIIVTIEALKALKRERKAGLFAGALFEKFSLARCVSIGYTPTHEGCWFTYKSAARSSGSFSARVPGGGQASRPGAARVHARVYSRARGSA